jgi:aquaporin Z
MKSGRRADSVALPTLSFSESLKQHWPEYLMEAAALGIFMISAGVFTALFECPGSFVHQAITHEEVRRAMIGVAMGATATGLIYSPWGKRSGAHMNPAVTITFLRLGKIPLRDALFYIVFQFFGGLVGVLLTALILGNFFTQPPVNYVATVPGPAGDLPAFLGELVIAFIMMGMIVYVSNEPAIAHFTGLFAGLLIMCYVTFEAPLSGFGMNPARTFASALPSGIWTAMWIYFTASPVGMLLAAQGYLLVKDPESIRCCKLHHRSDRRCIFCGRRTLPEGSGTDNLSLGAR